MEDDEQEVQAESLVEAKWIWKSEACRPEMKGRGSSASQSNGCCMRMECSISWRQSLRCISLKEETKMRRSRGNQRAANLDRQCQGVAMKGFRLVLFFDALMLPKSNAGECDGEESNSLRH